MAGDGTTFTIDIDAPIDSAEAAAASVAKLSDRLTAAKSAAAQAAEAVKAGGASFKAAESAADRAAKAVEKIGIAADEQRGKLDAALLVGNFSGADKANDVLQKLLTRQAEATQKANAAKAAMLAEATALEHLDAAARKAANDVEHLDKAHDQAKKASDAFTKAQDASRASGNFEGVTKGLKKLGGPLGPLADSAEDAAEGVSALAESIGVAGAVAAVAVVAIVAIVAALAAGAAAAVAWAVKMSDAARSSDLLAQGIDKTVDGGDLLNETIGNLSKTLPQTRDELRSMAADLAKTGLQGKELRDALEKSATAAAELKYGPDFKKQTISLNKLATRFGDNLSDIFGHLNIEGLLEGLGKMVDLFDKESVTGKALKAVFESLFQPLIDGVTSLIPKVIKGFIQLEIWFLKAMIAVKPYGSEILTVIEVLGVLAALVVGVVVVALAAGVAIAVAFWTILITLGEAMQAVTEAVVGLGSSIIDSLSNISLADIGKNLIAGLVGGIAGAGPSVVDALTGVVGGAVDAAKSFLGIHSPSTLMHNEVGLQMGAGVTGGLDESAGEVRGALEAMVSPPDVSSASAPVATTATGGGNTFNITVNAAGGDADSIAAKVKEVVLEILEGGGTQAGMAVANA